MGANITVVVVPALYEFMEVTVVLGLGLELAVTHIRWQNLCWSLLVGKSTFWSCEHIICLPCHKRRCTFCLTHKIFFLFSGVYSTQGKDHFPGIHDGIQECHLASMLQKKPNSTIPPLSKPNLCCFWDLWEWDVVPSAVATLHFGSSSNLRRSFQITMQLKLIL